MDNTILLNFINRSNDNGDSHVVIFQENMAESFRPQATVWKVIREVEPNDNFYFEYSPQFEISMGSSMMGGMPKMTVAEPGLAYEVVDHISGQELRVSEKRWVGNPNHIEIHNEHPNGVFDANCYRNGSLLATKKSLMNNGVAAFHFPQVLNFNVVSEMEDIDDVAEGEAVGSYYLLTASTQIPLGYITSADIVMTGGGSGPDAEPFQFTLENAKFKNIEL